jgi:hypothetical protein
MKKCLVPVRLALFGLLIVMTGLLSPLSAQGLSLLDSIDFIENAVTLRSGFAGGMNNPQFSQIHLDNDATMDMVIFDRSGNKITTYLNGGTANTVDYEYAPQYISGFPDSLEDFMVTADFNCDGKMDLFTASKDGISVYRNVSTAGNLGFVKVIDTLMSDRGAGPAFLFVPYTDIPAFHDIDNDGDLDLLTFDASGVFVEWHKNMIQENTNSCAGLELVLADACWGKFRENALSQDVVLNVTCRTPGPLTNPADIDPASGVHSGSTLAVFDEEDDGPHELVLGDLLFDGLTYLHNGGTTSAALMDSANSLYPQYDTPVRVHIFPAAFFLDVDNDSKEDMVVAPNGLSVSINYQSSWYYKNVDPGNGVLLSRQSTTFLQKDMVDLGLGAYPAIFDYNADSLPDLLIGNYTYKTSNVNVSSGLALYENVGTATDPKFELVTRDYGNFGANFNPPIYGLTPTFGDMNGDGDIDMLVGDSDGKIHYFENIAAPGQPVNFVLAAPNYKGIDVGQFAAPFIVDLDRDGLNDLVIGEMGGTLNYYRNFGTAQLADFPATPDDDLWGVVDTEPVCCTGFSIPFVLENPTSGRYDLLVGSESGRIAYYKDIESYYGTIFPLTSGDFGQIREGERTAITGGDINADGIWDWIVGNVRGGIAIYSGNSLLTEAPAPTTVTADVQLYPNPSQGELNLAYRVKAGEKFSVAITDVSGRSIYNETGNGSAGKMQIDALNWSPGVYFVALRVNGEFAGVKKWVLTE